MTNLTDNELIDLIKADDHNAFNELFRRHNKELLSRSRKYTYETQFAKDIISDIFADIWEKRESLKLEGVILAYLYKSVRNKVIDHIKHQKIKLKYSDFYHAQKNAEDDTDFRIRHKQLSDFIDQQIECLPPKIRTVISLRKQEMTRIEIASYLQMPVDTVKTNLRRGLALLKKRILPD